MEYICGSPPSDLHLASVVQDQMNLKNVSNHEKYLLKSRCTVDKWFHARPTHKGLECRVSIDEITDRRPWLFPLPILCWPPTTGEPMLQYFLTSQLEGYVSTWGKMVREDGAISENGIEALKHLRCNPDKWSKPKDICFQIHEEVKVDLGGHF
jgi:hypothetical protein